MRIPMLEIGDFQAAVEAMEIVEGIDLTLNVYDVPAIAYV